MYKRQGLDEEDTEDFRDRLLFQLQRPATSGNADHYRQWAREVAGVGDALVLPLHQGPGTVKVLVVDEDRTPAKPALLDEVFAHIEEERPIGCLLYTSRSISWRIRKGFKNWSPDF